jgi:Tfp pilus assembly protein PilN
MKTIDFLPDIYRQREALRRARVWWGLVVLLFGGTIGAAASAQGLLRHSLHRQLDDLQSQFSTAQDQVRELTELQAQTLKAAQAANLYTYLEHPWPRTQLLAEVVRPLPDSIHLLHIHIREEELPKVVTPAGPRRPAQPDQDPAKRPGAEQDLTKLQEEIDLRQTAIELEGRTADVSRLHQYVADVSRSPLIADARMGKLETSSGKSQEETHFSVRLIVRPGYGQRGREGAPQAPPQNSPHAAPPPATHTAARASGPVDAGGGE